MNKKQLLLSAVASVAALGAQAQKEELIKFGDFEQWLTRDVKESGLVGGKLRTLYEVGPTMEWPRNRPYTNQGGSPWATSNVYAKVAGVVKSNESVYADERPGGGRCAKLQTHVVSCKALGIINISVMAAGSLFLGELVEPVTSSSNPMSKMNSGIAFTGRPKALKFDYRVQLSGQPNRWRETMNSKKQVEGKDQCEVVLLLQSRWEDSDGNIHAKRVGTMWQRFTQDTPWQSGVTYDIHYGDIVNTSYYQPYMALQREDSPRIYYAKNSKGKNVMVQEDGWADENESPTHMVIYFNSSHGGAYVGSPGNTLWVDNVKLVY